MKIIECQQGSIQWFEARRGIPTASNFDRIITPKTGKLSAAADDYICELLGEQYGTGFVAEPFMTDAMRNGVLTEAEARKWYEMETDIDVQQVGFCLSDCGRFGCSPDGLVGEGGLELKCPAAKTQVSYLLDGDLPNAYRPQVHGALIVTGAPWWDFLSYARGLPPLRVRVTPDKFTEALKSALDQFLDRLQAARERLVALGEKT